MKLLLIDSEYFVYEPTKRAPKAKCHDLFKDKSGGEYSNVLVVFIAFEIGDKTAKFEKFLIDLKNIFSKNKNNSIVFIPNVHLTNKPLDGASAYKFYKKFIDYFIENTDAQIFAEAFGYSGSWKIISKPHEFSVLGRNY